MFDFFSRKPRVIRPLGADMHSHLIPGIDDGARTPEDSFAIIDQLLDSGYNRIITTPHIMTDYFGNTSQSVMEAYGQFVPLLREKGYTVPFDCAAEYYFDEILFGQVSAREKLLTFGDRHLLFETNMISEPLQIKEFIFALTSQGYRPVLAHPERYQYMTLEKAQDFRDRGVLLQLNLLSLIGYYGPQIQKTASKMIQQGLVDLLGTDCHNLEHAHVIKTVQKSRLYHKALDLPLLNFTLA